MLSLWAIVYKYRVYMYTKNHVINITIKLRYLLLMKRSLSLNIFIGVEVKKLKKIAEDIVTGRIVFSFW